MDAVFHELRPGQELQLKLVFADRKNYLLPPQALKIKRGSVYFSSKGGYFRLNSKGKVYSNPTGHQELELDSVVQQIQIYFNAIWNLQSSNDPTDDFKFKKQPISSEQGEGKYIGYIVVRLSQDFEGEMIGWQSCHGI